MSQRGKRPNSSGIDNGSIPVKRRKGRPPINVSIEIADDGGKCVPSTSSGKSGGAIWQPRPLVDLKMSSIYNRSAPEAPAELFRKDLISAMKLPDSEPLSHDEYWVITDQWKQEWERGVQVPVNPDSLPEPVVTILNENYYKGRQDFKLPKNKYIRITKDENFSHDKNYLSNTPALADSVCSYDLDQTDEAWLKVFNGERSQCGLPSVNEEQFERIVEELEIRCHDKIQAIMKNEEGLGIEYDENVICDVCRSPDSEEANEMVFCDNCNICVHQACYGITTIPSGQWLCRTCSMGQKPDCVLCPNKGGAMKSTRSGQKWAHVSCALWIPEVSIGSVDRMEPITKISSIPPSRWALICVLCRERVGACIQCSVKTCKTAYHVTCAFQHGLEMRAIIEDENAEDGVKLRSYCQKHSVNNKGKKEPKNTNNEKGSGEEPEEEKTSKKRIRKDMTSEERNMVRVQRSLEIEAEFDKHVSIKDISCHLLDVDQEGINHIYNYWILKRKAGGNRPLLLPKSDDVDVQSQNQEQADIEKMKMFVHLRQDLERVRNLCYMVSRRQKLSRSYIKMREQIFQKQVGILSRVKQEKVDEVCVNAILEANHGPSIYDVLYSSDTISANIKQMPIDVMIDSILGNNVNNNKLIKSLGAVSSGNSDIHIGTNSNNNNNKKSTQDRYKLFNGSTRRRNSNVTDSVTTSDSDSTRRSVRGSRKKHQQRNVDDSSAASSQSSQSTSTSEDETPVPVATTSRSPPKDTKKKEGTSRRGRKPNALANNKSRYSIESSSEEDTPKSRATSKLAPPVRPPAMPEHETNLSDESDELIDIKNSSGYSIPAGNNKRVTTAAIYSDTDSSTDKDTRTDHTVSDSQQQPFRTKAAMKEFNIEELNRLKKPIKPAIASTSKQEKEREKYLPPPTSSSSLSHHAQTSVTTAMEKENSQSNKNKDFLTDLFVPQREAAKKASENLMRANSLIVQSIAVPSGVRKEEIVEEKPVEREKELKRSKSIKENKKPGRPPLDEKRLKEKDKELREKEMREQKEKEEKDKKEKEFSDLFTQYVPQRQAAKKAAEHIKSGLGKVLDPTAPTATLPTATSSTTLASKEVEEKIKAPSVAKRKDEPKTTVDLSSSSTESSSTSGSDSSGSSSSSDSEAESPAKNQKQTPQKQPEKQAAINKATAKTASVKSKTKDSPFLDKVAKPSVDHTSSSSSSEDSSDSSASERDITSRLSPRTANSRSRRQSTASGSPTKKSSQSTNSKKSTPITAGSDGNSIKKDQIDGNKSLPKVQTPTGKQSHSVDATKSSTNKTSGRATADTKSPIPGAAKSSPVTTATAATSKMSGNKSRTVESGKGDLAKLPDKRKSIDIKEPSNTTTNAEINKGFVEPPRRGRKPSVTSPPPKELEREDPMRFPMQRRSSRAEALFQQQKEKEQKEREQQRERERKLQLQKEKEQKEKEQQKEREQREKEKKEKERLEKERLEKEKLEREKKEKLEREQKEREQKEKEIKLQKEKEEKERLQREKEQKEKERLQKEKERKEKEKMEKERMEKERQLQLQKEKEQKEKERLEKEQKEKERKEKERLEKERLEKEQMEKERKEKERLAKEKERQLQLQKEKEQKEKDRLEKEQKERMEKERKEKVRLQREKDEQEKLKKAESIKQKNKENDKEKDVICTDEGEDMDIDDSVNQTNLIVENLIEKDFMKRVEHVEKTNFDLTNFQQRSKQINEILIQESPQESASKTQDLIETLRRKRKGETPTSNNNIPQETNQNEMNFPYAGLKQNQATPQNQTRNDNKIVDDRCWPNNKNDQENKKSPYIAGQQNENFNRMMSPSNNKNLLDTTNIVKPIISDCMVEQQQLQMQQKQQQQQQLAQLGQKVAGQEENLMNRGNAQMFMPPPPQQQQQQQQQTMQPNNDMMHFNMNRKIMSPQALSSLENSHMNLMNDNQHMKNMTPGDMNQTGMNEFGAMHPAMQGNFGSFNNFGENQYPSAVSLFPPNMNVPMALPSPGQAMYAPNFTQFSSSSTHAQNTDPNFQMIQKPEEMMGQNNNMMMFNQYSGSQMMQQTEMGANKMDSRSSCEKTPKSHDSKKSPAKSVRASPRFTNQNFEEQNSANSTPVQSNRTPQKSPSKSPRVQPVDPFAKQTNKATSKAAQNEKGKKSRNNSAASTPPASNNNTANNSNRGKGRGRGRGRVQTPFMPMPNEFDYPQKLAGTVYDFNDDDLMHPSVDLRAMRDRRKSIDYFNKINRDVSSESPKFSSIGGGANAGKSPFIKSTTSSILTSSTSLTLNNHTLPNSLVNDAAAQQTTGASLADINPVLPGPVDMRTYSSYDSNEAFNNQLLGAFASNTVDQQLNDEIDEEMEKELHTALKASSSKPDMVKSSSETGTTTTSTLSVAEQVVEESVDSDTSFAKASLSDSRNQLKLKIKGPLANPELHLRERELQNSVEIAQQPIAVPNNLNPSSVVSTGGATNQRRMRKKELLRQYCAQDMNMEEQSNPTSIEPAVNSVPVQASRFVGFPKAVDSMSTIPTKEDYKEYATTDYKKRRKLTMSRELRQLAEMHPITTDPLAVPPINVAAAELDMLDSGKRRFRSRNIDTADGQQQQQQQKQAPNLSGIPPKLKIKIGNSDYIETMGVSDLSGRPPKKRIQPPNPPSYQDLKRESMNFRKKVFEEFAEPREKLHRSKEEKRLRKEEKKKKKKEKKRSLEVVATSLDGENSKAPPKLIIRFGKSAASSEQNSEQNSTSTNSSAPTDNSSNATIMPIRLKLARNSQGSDYYLSKSETLTESKEEKDSGKNEKKDKPKDSEKKKDEVKNPEKEKAKEKESKKEEDKSKPSKKNSDKEAASSTIVTSTPIKSSMSILPPIIDTVDISNLKTKKLEVSLERLSDIPSFANISEVKSVSMTAAAKKQLSSTAASPSTNLTIANANASNKQKHVNPGTKDCEVR